MVIKEKFELLKNTPNLLTIPAVLLKKKSEVDGVKNVRSLLLIHKNRIQDYTKKAVYKFIEDPKILKSEMSVTNLPDYILPVSLNTPKLQIILNPEALGVNDINQLHPNNLYALMVYGICMRRLVENKRVKVTYASPISNFLLSTFVQLFGKQYGLLGSFTGNIIKLKFLILTYVLVAFFGVPQTKAISLAYNSVGLKPDESWDQRVRTYDFSQIEDFIKALSDLGVMPGINKFTFTSRVLKSLSLEFLPALEDLTRFISVITVSHLTGSTIVPTYISRYNRDEYAKILEISKTIFK